MWTTSRNICNAKFHAYPFSVSPVAECFWIHGRGDFNNRYAGMPNGLKQWRTRGGVWVVQTPPPEIPKALQNRAKLNPIVKTVKKLLNLGRQHHKMFGKMAV